MARLISLKTIHLAPPTDNDRRAYDQRVGDELGLGPLSIPLATLKKLPHEVRKNSGALSCVVGLMDRECRLVEVGAERSYSLALDLGTTNMVFLLYDNASGKTVLTRSFENPQIAFGSDILTRLHHAMSARGAEVYAALLSGINRAVASLCDERGIRPSDIHGLAVAGNTVMSHFFLGLDVSTIPVDPFIPVVRTPGFMTASELSVGIHPQALVYVFPNAGSYVGGDIVSGIIATGLHRAGRPSILIDVGTNAEVVIGTGEWMLVGAGAAGPALEEGISRIGRRAKKGIIFDVEIKKGEPACKTFDGHAPEGICGSGMVSLLHALFQAGIIDQAGVLDRAAKNVITAEGEPAYAIACGGHDALVIRQSEIQNFMKSKAAMFTLLLVLVRSVGIAFRDIAAVFVSGALGTGIDARKAEAVGMLPAWPAEIVQARGNTSLEGARMLLADGGLVGEVNAFASRITYKHMHDDPEFMKEFLGAVFLPHTNPEMLKAT